jgi:hypothetical protein
MLYSGDSTSHILISPATEQVTQPFHQHDIRSRARWGLLSAYVYKHADLMVGNISSIIFFMMISLSRTSISKSSGSTPLHNPWNIQNLCTLFHIKCCRQQELLIHLTQQALFSFYPLLFKLMLVWWHTFLTSSSIKCIMVWQRNMWYSKERRVDYSWLHY